MPAVIRLPSPPVLYTTEWANRYTRALEDENQQLWNAILQLQDAELAVGATGITGGVSGDLLYDNAGVLGEIAPAALALTLTVGSTTIASGADHLLLYQNGTKLGEIANGTTGQVLTAATGATPAFAALPANVSSFNAGTTGLTPAVATTGAVTLAGTLAVANGGTGVTVSRALAQAVQTITTGVATGTTTIPFDDTIPQNTEGDQYMTQAITPKSSTSTLLIQTTFVGATNLATQLVVALFQDSTASALAAVTSTIASTNFLQVVTFLYAMTSGTTSATTFKIRAGTVPAAAGTVTFNGQAGGRIFGGVMASSMSIREFYA